MTVLLILFAATGTLLFRAFGITLAAFRTAGGLILWFVAIDMLRGERRTQEGREELVEGQAKEDVALTPLAIPMLAGPGVISTVIVIAGQARGLAQTLVVYGAIVLTGAISFLRSASVSRCWDGWERPASAWSRESWASSWRLSRSSSYSVESRRRSSPDRSTQHTSPVARITCRLIQEILVIRLSSMTPLYLASILVGSAVTSNWAQSSLGPDGRARPSHQHASHQSGVRADTACVKRK